MKNMRDIVALSVIAIFAIQMFSNPTDFEETLKTLIVMTVGYYLGASKTGADTAAKNSEIVGAAMAAQPSSSEPQPVTVVNDEDAPVPVESK